MDTRIIHWVSAAHDPSTRNDARLFVDTAGSWDVGAFGFPCCDGDVLVEILTPYDWQNVIVSARYTTPCDAGDAATLAVDAYHEREGGDVPWTGMGSPFYHVIVHWVGEPVRGLVRVDTGTGDWNWEPETKGGE